MSDHGNARNEWIDPRYEGTVTFYVQQIRQAASRHRIVACAHCHGLRLTVLLDPATKHPYRVPCSACDPSGV
ncbi:hypothetical protein [Streptomyces sp. G45]|uniref:hypothetical protein n=1 Tax=Streptomyces sp. G45 TaxID=3406627 RepID=UPI003C29612A